MQLSKYIRNALEAMLIYAIFMQANHEILIHKSQAQSIGFQPQFSLGFNPFLSPVYGYGLGLPFGAYSFSPLKHPSLLSTLPGAYADSNGFMSKIHAKAFFKKLALGQFGLHRPFVGVRSKLSVMKDKLNLFKHPELAFTPYGSRYGYGRHYGSALVANNPYKSVYSDYYDSRASV